MDINPQIEGSTEKLLPTLSYENYREFCDDSNSAYRLTGILDPDIYQAAVEDPATKFVDTPNGALPLLIPIEHTTGYDVERIKIKTGKSNVFLLSAPVESVISGKLSVEGLELEDSAILVESDTGVTSEAKQALPSLLGEPEGYKARDFVDDRLENDENKTAWMGIYLADIKAFKDIEVVGESLEDTYNQLGGEYKPENGLALYGAQALVGDEKLSDELWDLFKSRFSWLGENHPVSMEDTREVFDELVLSDGAYVTVKFEDGKAVGAGIFLHNLDICESWLSKNCINELKQKHDSGFVPMFFPGIAAKPENAGSAEEIVKFHCEIAAKTGIDYSFSFESSNMSSTYIPRIVQDYILGSGYYEFTSEGIGKVGSIDYWYLTQE